MNLVFGSPLGALAGLVAGFLVGHIFAVEFVRRRLVQKKRAGYRARLAGG